MTRRIKRGLSPEDAELWERVKETANPMHSTRVPDAKPNLLRPTKKKKKSQETASIPAFKVGQNAKAKATGYSFASRVVDGLAANPVQMDHKRFGKLKRGKLSPEARIDLHGMTLAAAHPRLIEFIFRSHADGKRLVLIITGKGKKKDEGGPIPVRHGVLRHQVPHWLGMAPLNQIVMQVVQSHQNHGGGGAYYVYLRRAR